MKLPANAKGLIPAAQIESIHRLTPWLIRPRDISLHKSIANGCEQIKRDPPTVLLKEVSQQSSRPSRASGPAEPFGPLPGPSVDSFGNELHPELVERHSATARFQTF